jgi:ABC-2 type transport system ATP-binding protein
LISDVVPNAPRDLDGRKRSCAPVPDQPRLELNGVARHYGRGNRRSVVLRDVDLQVAPGTATGICGRNGAGKTTLLRIATGILAPSAGTVRLDGLTAEGDWREYHRRIGFLSAGDRGLYPRLSVRHHLRYAAALAFVPRSTREQAVQDALEHFSLGDLKARRAARLSQGQRQRLRLALTFVHRPSVVLLDEPRNSLDGEGFEMLTAAVRQVTGGGGAVIWCVPADEDQDFAFDRMYVIENGTLAAG